MIMKWMTLQDLFLFFIHSLFTKQAMLTWTKKLRRIKEFKIRMVLHFTARNVGGAIWASWPRCSGASSDKETSRVLRDGLKMWRHAGTGQCGMWAVSVLNLSSHLQHLPGPGPRLLLLLSIENIPTTVAPGPGCGDAARRASGQNPGWGNKWAGWCRRLAGRWERCSSALLAPVLWPESPVTTSTWVSPLSCQRVSRAGRNNDLCCLARCHRLGLVHAWSDFPRKERFLIQKRAFLKMI